MLIPPLRLESLVGTPDATAALRFASLLGTNAFGFRLPLRFDSLPGTTVLAAPALKLDSFVGITTALKFDDLVGMPRLGP